MLVVIELFLIAGLTLATKHLVKTKSWIPGLILPAFLIVLFVLALRFGYPPWTPPVDFTDLSAPNHSALSAEVDNQGIRQLLCILHITTIISFLRAYIRERRKLRRAGAS